MTLPYERSNAVSRTREFLLCLCDAKVAPRVPEEVREQARRLLKHYPGDYHLELAGQRAPEVFGHDPGQAV